MDYLSQPNLNVFLQTATLQTKQAARIVWSKLTAQLPMEGASNSFKICAILLLDNIAIHSLTLSLQCLMERAKRIHQDLNTTLLIFSSQENYVTTTEPFLNVDSATENALLEDAKAI